MTEQERIDRYKLIFQVIYSTKDLTPDPENDNLYLDAETNGIWRAYTQIFGIQLENKED